MFAVRASHVVDAVKELRSAKHSLHAQSRCDLTRRDHSDGWGLVSYHGDHVRWHRESEPAYQDTRFDAAIRQSLSKTIVAHVRRASRGERRQVNCHPFVFGRWTFAHNGTLTAVDQLREGLSREVSKRLRKNIIGETDSELIFYWLLQRLVDSGAINGNKCIRLTRMRSTIAAGLLELERRNADVESSDETDRVARLNFILTNGTVLVGTRFRNSLVWFRGTSGRERGHPRQWIAIASEPTDSRRWKEVADGSVFSVSSDVKWTCESFA